MICALEKHHFTHTAGITVQAEGLSPARVLHSELGLQVLSIFLACGNPRLFPSISSTRQFGRDEIDSQALRQIFLAHFFMDVPFLRGVNGQKRSFISGPPPSRSFLRDGISTKDRRAFLEDSRTWSASTIIELLFQTGKLGAQIYRILNTARKARNAFVHRSAPITREIAQAALSGAIELASLRLAGTKNAFHANEIISLVEARSRSPLGQRMKGEDSPQYVARLPVFPAPSFPEWGDRPYEIIEEFCFERVDQTSIQDAV